MMMSKGEVRGLWVRIGSDDDEEGEGQDDARDSNLLPCRNVVTAVAYLWTTVKYGGCIVPLPTGQLVICISSF